MKSKNTQGYMTRGDKIYVQGSIDGIFKRYSTGLKATKNNLTYIKNNHLEELHKIHHKKNEVKVQSDEFVSYAISTLLLSNKKRNENTAKEYNQIFEKRIQPFFCDYKLTDIKRNDLQTWQQKLVDSGLSAKRVNNIRSVFNFILEEARKDELIDKNYFSLIDREKEKKVEIDPFSLDEVKLILSKANGWEKYFIQISFFTGMRTGELVALKWEDINFVAKTITVRSGVRKGTLGATKTNVDRKITMLPIVEEALNELRKFSYLRNSFVFLNGNGTHFYDGSIIRNGVWKNTLKLCGLDYRKLYVTRHTFASIMISAGEDIAWVSNMLGHANLQVTLTRYAKFIKTDLKQRATFLNDFNDQKICTKGENCTDLKLVKSNITIKKVS